MRNIMNLVNLSFNNFLSVKKMALFILVAFGGASLVNPSFSTMLMGMMTYVIAYQTMAYEDSYGIDYMISHLPVTKNEYVISRYIFCIITIVGASILCSLIFFISNKVNLVDLSGIDYKMILYIGIISAVTLVSVFTPVLLYFGMKKGRMAMVFIFMIIVMIPSLIVNDMEMAINILNKLSEININLFSGILTILMLLISYFITRFLYEKKEVI
ncbi:ABC-2 transporter permease [Terrisporobacter vanillatitrophus]|uniref:ABC-2 transporter permease n=1 Tax=Terrisporobacter vanillatitrophus TaxID=3058402 RepID=UPI003368C8F1